jgi:DNA-binding response OmpR family regulator
VEDHQKLLDSLQRGLERVGHSVLTAGTGEEGFRLALDRDVEMVVLDLMLPGKSGFEILVELRKVDFRKPVLILSAKDSPEDRQRARECGANGFLIKPFAFADLVSRLSELLEQRPPGDAGG